ncbi:MAG: HNH endonuclease [Cetobacterium sp.]
MLNYFKYSPESPSGLLVIQKNGITRTGGSKTKRGYWKVRFKGRQDYAHRVVWQIHNGDIPEGFMVDHRDGDPSNNLISNLRLATASQNTSNRKTMMTNTSGFRNVTFHKQSGKWMASFVHKGEQLFLGLHDTPEAAAEVAKVKRLELKGEFNRD